MSRLSCSWFLLVRSVRAPRRRAHEHRAAGARGGRWAWDQRLGRGEAGAYGSPSHALKSQVGCCAERRGIAGSEATGELQSFYHSTGEAFYWGVPVQHLCSWVFLNLRRGQSRTFSLYHTPLGYATGIEDLLAVTGGAEAPVTAETPVWEPSPERRGGWMDRWWMGMDRAFRFAARVPGAQRC